MFKIEVSGVGSTYNAAALDQSKDLIKAYNKAYTDVFFSEDRIKTFPLIIQNSNHNKYGFDKSDYSTFVTYNGTNFSTSFYKDLNKDKEVQKTFTKYYYYKILDKWIYKELLPLLAFINISDGKPHLIKSISDFNIKKLSENSDEEIDKKIDYLENILLTKNMVKHVLKNICNDNNINWYDLNLHEGKIKKVFYNYMLHKLKNAIKEFGVDK